MCKEEPDQIELIKRSLPEEHKCLITYYPEWNSIYYDGNWKAIEKVKQEIMRGSRQPRILILSVLLNFLMLIFIAFLIL